MGKRTQQTFTKSKRDYYPTVDPDAVKPLIPFIRGLKVAEPCAGAGDLADLLEDHCFIEHVSDIEPQKDHILKQDALDLRSHDLLDVDVIVTNPPFSWNLLQPLLDHFQILGPHWFLLPADVMHNKRMAPYMEYCEAVVSVGRLYWMENKIKGVDNYAWFLFVPYECNTRFYGRTD